MVILFTEMEKDFGDLQGIRNQFYSKTLTCVRIVRHPKGSNLLLMYN